MSSPKAYVAVTNDLNQDQRMHRICTTLHNLGFHVTLIGRSKRDSQKLYSQVFDQYRLPLFFQSGILFYIEYHIRLFIYLLLSASPQILFSVDLDTALPVRAAAFFRRSTVIHDAHELFTDVPELMHSPIKRWIWTMVGNLTMKGFDHRFTVNDSLSRILESKYGCTFVSMRNLPTAKEKSTAHLDAKRPYIWYQGVLNEGRGLEQMIAAMESLSDFDFRIAGEGDKSLSLRLQAEESVAADRIIFHGWMSADEMHSWASNAWLGINLLDRNAGNYYHSLANRTFDYIQAELPAVHMDFPEYRAVVSEYNVGVLIDDLDVETITNMIHSLQKNHSQYERLKMACSRAKSKLTWESESKNMIELITH